MRQGRSAIGLRALLTGRNEDLRQSADRVIGEGLGDRAGAEAAPGIVGRGDRAAGERAALKSRQFGPTKTKRSPIVSRATID